MPTKLRSLTFIIILGSTLLAAVGCAKKKPPSKPSPTPATTAGGCGRSRARATEVVTYAAPPSEMRHESSRHNGSASFGAAR